MLSTCMLSTCIWFLLYLGHLLFLLVSLVIIVIVVIKILVLGGSCKDKSKLDRFVMVNISFYGFQMI